MMQEASKRRKINLLSLSFVSKLISKKNLIKNLKRDNQLQLFRRLERSSEKLISSKCALEFIQLCESFDLIPTFAKVTSTKSKKWSQSSKNFEQNVITEELSQKKKQISVQKDEVIKIFTEIRKNCSTLRYICILKAIVHNNNQAYRRRVKVHTNKISRMLAREMDVDKHIQNISSYKLTFFQKLALCRGLQFAFPTRINDKDVLASFEKTYRVLEPSLIEEKKELTASTLRSISLNYIERKGPTPPRSLKRALGQLRKRDDIIVTKPDKGTSVVVIDKSQYNELLSEASINNQEKFRSVTLERPKTRGRPPKHYHPLLQREKELEIVVRRILLRIILRTAGFIMHFSPLFTRLSRFKALCYVNEALYKTPSAHTISSFFRVHYTWLSRPN
jgi:hypothetical protein